jgi:hypothetical protein
LQGQAEEVACPGEEGLAGCAEFGTVLPLARGNCALYALETLKASIDFAQQRFQLIREALGYFGSHHDLPSGKSGSSGA